MKTIKLIKTLVEQELKEFGGGHAAGGIMDPGMVPFVPHREPAADTADEPTEPTEADRLYKVGVAARLAAEDLVKALDHPIYDQAYEAAFKASAALRDALNAIESTGAEPENEDRIVAPSKEDQPLGTGLGVTHMPMTYTGDTVSEAAAPDVTTLSKLLTKVGFAEKVKELIDKPIEAFQLLNAIVDLISVDEKIKALVLRKLHGQQVAPQEKTATSGGKQHG